MKNKLNSNNLMNAYYDDGIYELKFNVDNKNVFVRNIKEQDNPNAWTDEWYFDNDDVLEEIIKNVDDEDIEIEGESMMHLEGKKVKDLTVEEREYLETRISGGYMGDYNLVIGKNEVVVDFDNGLSVNGWIVNTEEEMYYELDEEAEIYYPSK